MSLINIFNIIQLTHPEDQHLILNSVLQIVSIPF